jgi:hypothetical protein
MSKFAEDISGLTLMFCAQRNIQISEEQVKDLSELLEMYAEKYYSKQAEEAIRLHFK